MYERFINKFDFITYNFFSRYLDKKDVENSVFFFKKELEILLFNKTYYKTLKQEMYKNLIFENEIIIIYLDRFQLKKKHLKIIIEYKEKEIQDIYKIKNFVGMFEMYEEILKLRK